MAKFAFSLVLLGSFIFTLVQLVSADQQQENGKAKSIDVEVRPRTEPVQSRILREAGGNKKTNEKPKKKKCQKGETCRKGRKRTTKKKCKRGNNCRRRGKKAKRTMKKKCKKGEKCEREGKKIRRTKMKKCKNGGKCKRKGEKTKRTTKKKCKNCKRGGKKTKEEKRKKGNDEMKKNPVQRDPSLNCDAENSCLTISKHYKKYRSNLQQIRRIRRNCDIIKRKYDKGCGIDGIFNAAGDAICTSWQSPTISAGLKDCNTTICTICKVPANCTDPNLETCEDTIDTYQKAYDNCTKTVTDKLFCLCVKAIANPPNSTCLNWKTLDDEVKAAKKQCVSKTFPGSFGWCRHEQEEAANDCNCPPPTNTSMTTSGSTGRKQFLRRNFVKKWIKH